MVLSGSHLWLDNVTNIIDLELCNTSCGERVHMNLLPRRFPSARIVGRVLAPIHVRNSEIAFYLIFSLLSWSDTVQRRNDIFHRTTSIMKVSELWIDSLPLILFHSIVAAPGVFPASPIKQL